MASITFSITSTGEHMATVKPPLSGNDEVIKAKAEMYNLGATAIGFLANSTRFTLDGFHHADADNSEQIGTAAAFAKTMNSITGQNYAIHGVPHGITKTVESMVV
jgi:non-ribosomal peptide synthetase component E (peptide arylation enzyme)